MKPESITIKNIESVSEQLSAGDGILGQASSTLTDVSNASIAFEIASRDLQAFGATADEKIAAFGDDMSLLIGDMREVAIASKATADESRRAVTAAADAIEGPATQTLSEARMASQDLRVLITRLDRMAREIEQNPQGFVVGDAVPYEEKRK